MIHYERLKGVQSSGVLLFFWLLALLCATITFRSKVLHALDQVSPPLSWVPQTTVRVFTSRLTRITNEECLASFQPSTICVWRYTTFFVYYTLLLVSLILSCLSDRPPLFSQVVRDSVSLFPVGSRGVKRVTLMMDFSNPLVFVVNWGSCSVFFFSWI